MIERGSIHHRLGEEMGTRRTRVGAVAVASALLLALVVNYAHAGKLRVSERGFRIMWTELEFRSEAFEPIKCPVTLEGSFAAATIAKVRDAAVGYITRAVAAEASCQNGRLHFEEFFLPWEILYQEFSGTLPNITTIRWHFFRPRFDIETGVDSCFIEQSLDGIMRLTNGVIETFEFETETFRLRSILACDFATARGFWQDDGVVVRLVPNRVVLTLI